MDNLIDCLNDISNLNVIYTIILVATASNTTTFTFEDILNRFNRLFGSLMNSLNLSSLNPKMSSASNQFDSTDPLFMMTSSSNAIQRYDEVDQKPSLLIRMFQRLALISDNFVIYLQTQFRDYTTTSIASVSVLIIVASIILYIMISLAREENRKLKEQYKKLNAGSSQSFIAINASNKGINQFHNNLNSFAGAILAHTGSHNQYSYLSSARSSTATTTTTTTGSGAAAPITTTYSSNNSRCLNDYSNNIMSKLHVIELRRETYFGLVRLLKPGCRTIVLLCDTQSRLLLAKFYRCIYPYRKNKTLQFAFLLIGKNINWYKDLLGLALNEKRDLQINPINCIGTVLVLNGFKKYFSVYHASDSRNNPDIEPFKLLEESLLDNFSDWLEKLFAGKVSRYHVKYWPERMR